MKKSRFLLGFAGGFAGGYAAYRAYESPRSLKRQRPAVRDAGRYGATRRALALTGIARSLAGASLLAFGPVGEVLERNSARFPVWLRPVAFALQGAVLDAILELPVDFAEDYVLEHRYGLSEQSIPSWFSDRMKQEAIGTAIATILAGAFAGAMRRWPSSWPYIASGAALPLFLIANIVVPVYILPLFNTYRPIEGPLEQRLRALAARYGVGNADILRVDMSKQTKKANAFVTGIGKTHRIVVGDTLIEHFPEEEIEFVVAHELGHYVSKDSWRMIAMAEVSAIIVLFGAYAAQRERSAKSAEQPRTLAQVQLWATLLAQLLRPAVSGYARSREWAADRFALLSTRAPHTGASAFRRLRDQNLAEDEQPAWFEFIFSTHPSLKARIAELESIGPRPVVEQHW
jgi:STE24 endopeptidase